MKQRRATYDFANKAAWAEATEEEDAAIAEQAELDAASPPTEEDLSSYLPITVQVSAGEPTETEGSGAAGGTCTPSVTWPRMVLMIRLLSMGDRHRLPHRFSRQEAERFALQHQAR